MPRAGACSAAAHLSRAEGAAGAAGAHIGASGIGNERELSSTERVVAPGHMPTFVCLHNVAALPCRSPSSLLSLGHGGMAGPAGTRAAAAATTTTKSPAGAQPSSLHCRACTTGVRRARQLSGWRGPQPPRARTGQRGPQPSQPIAQAGHAPLCVRAVVMHVPWVRIDAHGGSSIVSEPHGKVDLFTSWGIQVRDLRLLDEPPTISGT